MVLAFNHLKKPKKNKSADIYMVKEDEDKTAEQDRNTSREEIKE